MTDTRLRSLDPRCLHHSLAGSDATHKEAVVERFSRFYSGMRDSGANDYDLDRIATAIFYLRTLLLRTRLADSRLTAIEIGCGAGAKSISLAGVFGEYIGIDIDPTLIRDAVHRNHLYGSSNTRFICGNATDIFRNRKSHAIPDKIDVLILYAVLEHLTMPERADVLAIASEVVADGGSVVVMESPNLLMPFDSHTTGCHFYNWLPDKLAGNFAKLHAARSSIREMINTSSSEKEALSMARAGRGVSYYDFDFWLQRGPTGFNLLADGYDVEMLNMEPLTFQEFTTLGYLMANETGIPPLGFSRSWLDIIISNEPVRQEKSFISPFWPNWLNVTSPPTFWHPVAIPLNDWHYDFDRILAPPTDITLLFRGNAAKIGIYMDETLCGEVDLRAFSESKPATWHDAHAVSLALPPGGSSLRISNISGDQVFFNGAILSAPASVSDKHRAQSY
jgi:2-polyprenyl-3-methyl-5-hydroxy-6-metoxy-1,4-benzoquinol methylase